MRQALRHHISTAIVVVVGASLIAAVPAAPPPHHIQRPAAQQSAVTLAADASGLFAPYEQLVANTATNLQALSADSGFSTLLTQLFTNPSESLAHLPDAIGTLMAVAPEISTHVLPLPALISVDLPPWLSLTLAELGPLVTVYTALQDIISQATNVSDPVNALSAISGAPATILNALLNAHTSIDLSGVSIPVFDGILASPQPVEFSVTAGQLANDLGFGDQTLTGLLNQLGVGDQSMQSVLTGLLDSAGVGSQTPVELLDKLGVGDQTLASLLTGLLGATGTGDPTITGLLEQAGLGDLSVGALLKELLNATVGSDVTVTGLLEKLGVGGLSLGGLLSDAIGNTTTVTGLLNQLGVGDMTLSDLVGPLLGSQGQQTLADLLASLIDKQFGVSNTVTVGDLAIDILKQEGINMTLAEVLQNAKLSNTTLGELLTGTTLGEEPFTTLLNQAGVGQESLGTLGNISGFDCFILGLFYGVNCGASLDSFMGPNTVLQTIENLHSSSGQSLADVTLSQVLSASGEANEPLSQIITGLNLSTPFDTVLNNLGFNTVDATTVLTKTLDSLGLGNTTLDSLFNDWGVGSLSMTTVVDKLGLDNVNLVGLLTSLNLNTLDVDTVIDRLGLDNVTVNSLLGDLDPNGVHLDTVINSLLGDVTIGSVLTDLGLNNRTLDTVVDNVGLANVTPDSLLSDLGIGNLDVDTLLGNLGVSGNEVISVNIGGVAGSLPYLFDDLPQLLAAALGAI